MASIKMTPAGLKVPNDITVPKPVVRLHEGIGKFIEWYKSDLNPLK